MVVVDNETLTAVISQWLGRIAMTVVIALMWHWYNLPAQKPFVDTGKRLMENHDADRRLKRLNFLEDQLQRAAMAVQESSPAGEEREEIKEEIIEQEIEPINEFSESSEARSITKELKPTILSDNTPERPRPALASVPQTKPTIKSNHSGHPGLAGFNRWFDIESSLYRIYTIGTVGTEVAPPFIPRSERGHVALKLEIQNSMHRAINVFWIDYKGKEVLRGTIHGNNGFFYQTTWIGHPWTFRFKDTNELVLHFIPYRVIPTTDTVPTTSPEEPDVGIHAFTLHRPKNQEDVCCIQDPVFPMDMHVPQQAVAWSFQHMSRHEYMYSETLMKYLTNVVRYPKESKYRQIRTAGKIFYNQVWNTPGRGLLLAAGFVEEGAYAELGSMNPLPRDRVQELSTLLFYLEQWRRTQEQQTVPNVQPTGADGGGRANFGRAGQIN